MSLLLLRVVLEIELDSQEVFEREVFERGFLDRFLIVLHSTFIVRVYATQFMNVHMNVQLVHLEQ